jgi:plastocyanin
VVVTDEHPGVRTTGGWAALLRAAAVVDVVLVVGVGVGLRDKEAVAFGLLLAAGLVLLRWRTGLWGRIVLGFVFVDVEFWMLTAALSNVSHHGRVLYVVIPVALAVSSAVGLVAAVAVGRAEGAARPVAIAGVVLIAVALGVSQLPGVGHSDAARAGDVKVKAKNIRFAPETIDVKAGPVSVRLRNHDLFWHTFTVDGLHVDIAVPVGGARRATFTATPGRYEFYCRIPGHKQAGMKGTLIVS